jgi:hypothetical protein
LTSLAGASLASLLGASLSPANAGANPADNARQSTGSKSSGFVLDELSNRADVEFFKSVTILFKTDQRFVSLSVAHRLTVVASAISKNEAILKSHVFGFSPPATASWFCAVGHKFRPRLVKTFTIREVFSRSAAYVRQKPGEKARKTTKRFPSLPTALGNRGRDSHISTALTTVSPSFKN